MKISTSDILAILRRYNEADDSHVPRNIDQVKQSHPSPINQLVAFRFARNFYYLLIDETAEDNKSYVLEQIRTTKSELTGELLNNPLTEFSTFGLPFKGKDVYLYKAKRLTSRLDILLAERHRETSRSTWQKHIKAGHIAVNGEVTISPKHEASPTDSIEIAVPEPIDFGTESLPILYLDDDVIVVDKPIGILTHSKGALNDEFTVADFFQRYTNVGLETNRPGIIHRLDRDTSGVIIGARTPEAFDLLKKQFSDRKAKKTYIAAVKGHLDSPRAVIDVPIGRNPSSPSTFRADMNGKPAVTSYEVIDQSKENSLLQLQPTTGRTHQLRVHLSYLGHPIIGDKVYGKPADRLYLHAKELEITIPGGKRVTFAAPLPPEFIDLFPGSIYGKSYQ